MVKANASWANRQRCGPVALLARCMGHSNGPQRHAHGHRRASALYRLIGPHTGSHMVRGLRTRENTGGSTRDLCLWRGSQTCRLCAGHCRWRFACLASLLGLGQAVTRSHPCTCATFFFCAALFCAGQLGTQKNDSAVVRCHRHLWLGTFRRASTGPDFGGRRRHRHCLGYGPATISARSKSRCCLGLDHLPCHRRHHQRFRLVAMANRLVSFI